MIEILDKKTSLSYEKIALQAGRYKKRGYRIIGIGYPFFHNELRGLLKLCDFWVDNINSPTTERWQHQYSIHDVNDLHNIGEFIVLIFSSNRHSILRKIRSQFPDAPLFEIHQKSKEIIKTINDIERSKFLTLRILDKSNFSIGDSISIAGQCEINHSIMTNLNIHALDLSEGSQMHINSRFQNQVDSLILRKNTIFSVDLDGKVDVKNCYIGKDSKIHIYAGSLIMDDVYFGDNCTLHVYDRLTIGSGSVISWNVNILDGDGHSLYYGSKNNQPRAIHIENNVWIGNNVTILKGVTIGQGSVVGAGSIVTHSVPPHSLVAGNPAKLIQSNIMWEYNYLFTK